MSPVIGVFQVVSSEELESQAAAMREALEQVQETAENSRRAESKGSGPYTLTFFLACLDKLGPALSSTAGAALLERLRKAEERVKALEQRVRDGEFCSCCSENDCDCMQEPDE